MRKYKFENWYVAYRRHEENIKENRSPFRIIPNPLMYWAADPFILYKDGRYYIFAELYHRITYKGRIGYCILAEKGERVSKWKTAFKEEVHLSFPYIFQKKNEIYIMPESCQAKDLRLYKCIKFPYKWELIKVLIEDEVMADTVFLDENTLLSYDNISRPRKLLKYERKEFCWRKTESIDDYEIALRPAGKIFRNKGQMFIPLQSSTEEMYGKEVYIYRISEDKAIGSTDLFELKLSIDNVRLSELPYEAKGIHTFNFDGDYEVIDVKTYTGNMLSFFGYSLRRIREIIGSRRYS